MSVVEIRSAAAVDPVGNVVSVHEPTFRDDTGPSRITYEGGLASSHLRRPLIVDNQLGDTVEQGNGLLECHVRFYKAAHGVYRRSSLIGRAHEIGTFMCQECR